jgi:hypothetical protein
MMAAVGAGASMKLKVTQELVVTLTQVRSASQNSESAAWGKGGDELSKYTHSYLCLWN